MVRILAIAWIFIPLFVANAQVKVDATPTGQHASAGASVSLVPLRKKEHETTLST